MADHYQAKKMKELCLGCAIKKCYHSTAQIEKMQVNFLYFCSEHMLGDGDVGVLARVK